MEGPTQIIPVAPEPPPVFVDPSGRRRRWLRRTAYGLGLAGTAYTAMVGVSFAGGPISPANILPFVEPSDEPWQPPAPAAEPTSERAVPAPSPTSVVPPLRTTPAGTGTATGEPSVTPTSPTPSVSPPRSTPSSPRPTRTPTPTVSPSASPSPSPSATPPSDEEPIDDVEAAVP